jgi:protein involved in polysaccharide export with SLBB domain
MQIKKLISFFFIAFISASFFTSIQAANLSDLSGIASGLLGGGVEDTSSLFKEGGLEEIRDVLQETKIQQKIDTGPENSVGTQNVIETLSLESKFSRIEELFRKKDYRAESKFNREMRLAGADVEVEKTSSLGNKQYGYDIFSKPWAKEGGFTQVNIPVGPDYILGPGDNLILYLWGKIEERIKVTLDNEGKIVLPRVGEVYLGGETFDNAKKILKKELGKYYVNFELNVTMGKLRTIKVFLLGEVASPGAYNIMSLSTVFHSLYIAGGPSKMGSLRNIKLIRGSKTIATIDTYRYLLYGDRSQDPNLKDHDTILVPAIGSVVKIDGMVKRPAIYEVKKGESIADIIKMAGGLTYNYFYKRLQVTRIDQGQQRVVLDYNFKNYNQMARQHKSKYVQDGDVIEIFSIDREIKNYVTILGNVKRSGDYDYQANLTLADLLKKAQGFKDGTYLNRIEVYRYVSDNQREIIVLDYTDPQNKKFQLQDWDLVKTYTKEDILGYNYVEITGAIQKPGAYKLLDNMRLLDLLYIGETESDATLKQAELVRTDSEGIRQIYTIAFEEIVAKPQSAQNLYLKAGDQIFIRNKPESMSKKTVLLSGEVKYPGEYALSQGESISSVLARAGGFTKKAFLRGAVFTRPTLIEIEQKGQAKILQDEIKQQIYRPDLFNSRSGVISYLKNQINGTPGRLVVNLRPLAELKNTKEDLVLEGGDIVFIPATPISVQLVGGVQQPTSLVYEQNRRDADYYIEQAGGFTEYADHGKIYVIKANGLMNRNLGNIELGDTIYVSEQVKISIDWLAVLDKTTSVMASIVTTIVLWNQIF